MSIKHKIAEPEANLKFIDVHCHIPFPRPKNDKLPSDDAQYQEFLKQGGLYLITCSIDIITLNLVNKFIEGKEKLGFTCGWAPQTVTYTPKKQYEEDWIKWIDFIKNNKDKYLAIGEIGLDFHHARTLEKRNKQVAEFKKILEITGDLDKPYVLHVRNASNHEHDKEHPNHRYNKPDGANREILKILKDYKINPKNVMWHCFSGPEEYGKLLPKQGFLLSVPSSAYGFQRWQRVSKDSPIDNIVTETDSYYQHPYQRGPINVPTNVRYSIAAIAHIHGLSQKIVSQKTILNAINFFKLDISR